MATSLTEKKRKSPQGPGYFAVGFLFRPTDAELLGHYLAKKVRGEEEDGGNFFIHEAKVYESHPSELVSSYAPAVGTEEWLFFTQRERKYSNGKRTNRRVGTGFWKATGNFPEVSEDGKKLGNKRSLVFFEESDPASSSSKKRIKTNWIMQEFVLLDHPDSWVCCKIYHHGKRPRITSGTADDHDQCHHQQQLVPDMGSSHCHQLPQLVPDMGSPPPDQTTSADYLELLPDT